MRASPLQAIRLSVINLAAACHFWESAFGFRLTATTEVHDAVLRRLWETEGGAMHVARLEKLGEPFARLELYQWEGCTGEPIRDAGRPWDPGVRELQFRVEDPGRSIAQLERLQCQILDGSVFVTPFGERCRLVSQPSPAVALTVASLQEATPYFNAYLGWTAAGLATDRLLFTAEGSIFPQIEVGEHRRLADPRLPVETAARMSPRYTGVWMLNASTTSLPTGDSRIVDVEVPFVGRRRAIVSRAPGGVRFGVYEAS